MLNTICTNLQNATVDNYCAFYECKDHEVGWDINFDTCICLDADYLKKVNSGSEYEKFKEFPRCCPETFLSSSSKKKENEVYSMQCPRPGSETSDYTCAEQRFESSSIDKATVNGDQVSLKSGPNTFNLNTTSLPHCVGLVYDQTDVNHPVKMKLFYCKTFKPCNGTKPCIRYLTYILTFYL